MASYSGTRKEYYYDHETENLLNYFPAHGLYNNHWKTSMRILCDSVKQLLDTCMRIDLKDFYKFVAAYPNPQDSLSFAKFLEKHARSMITVGINPSVHVHVRQLDRLVHSHGNREVGMEEALKLSAVVRSILRVIPERFPDDLESKIPEDVMDEIYAALDEGREKIFGHYDSLKRDILSDGDVPPRGRRSPIGRTKSAYASDDRDRYYYQQDRMDRDERRGRCEEGYGRGPDYPEDRLERPRRTTTRYRDDHEDYSPRRNGGRGRSYGESRSPRFQPLYRDEFYFGGRSDRYHNDYGFDSRGEWREDQNRDGRCRDDRRRDYSHQTSPIDRYCEDEFRPEGRGYSDRRKDDYREPLRDGYGTYRRDRGKDRRDYPVDRGGRRDVYESRSRAPRDGDNRYDLDLPRRPSTRTGLRGPSRGAPISSERIRPPPGLGPTRGEVSDRSLESNRASLSGSSRGLEGIPRAPEKSITLVGAGSQTRRLELVANEEAHEGSEYVGQISVLPKASISKTSSSAFNNETSVDHSTSKVSSTWGATRQSASTPQWGATKLSASAQEWVPSGESSVAPLQPGWDRSQEQSLVADAEDSRDTDATPVWGPATPISNQAASAWGPPQSSSSIPKRQATKGNTNPWATSRSVMSEQVQVDFSEVSSQSSVHPWATNTDEHQVSKGSSDKSSAAAANPWVSTSPQNVQEDSHSREVSRETEDDVAVPSSPPNNPPCLAQITREESGEASAESDCDSAQSAENQIRGSLTPVQQKEEVLDAAAAPLSANPAARRSEGPHLPRTATGFETVGHEGSNEEELDKDRAALSAQDIYHTLVEAESKGLVERADHGRPAAERNSQSSLPEIPACEIATSQDLVSRDELSVCSSNSDHPDRSFAKEGFAESLRPDQVELDHYDDDLDKQSFSQQSASQESHNPWTKTQKEEDSTNKGLPPTNQRRRKPKHVEPRPKNSKTKASAGWGMSDEEQNSAASNPWGAQTKVQPMAGAASKNNQWSANRSQVRPIEDLVDRSRSSSLPKRTMPLEEPPSNYSKRSPTPPWRQEAADQRDGQWTSRRSTSTTREWPGGTRVNNPLWNSDDATYDSDMTPNRNLNLENLSPNRDGKVTGMNRSFQRRQPSKRASSPPPGFGNKLNRGQEDEDNEAAYPPGLT